MSSIRTPHGAPSAGTITGSDSVAPSGALRVCPSFGMRFAGERETLLSWFASLGAKRRPLATAKAPLQHRLWRAVCHVDAPVLTAADFATALWGPAFQGADQNSLQITLRPSGKSKLLAVEANVQRMVWVVDGSEWAGVVKRSALQSNVDGELTPLIAPPASVTSLVDGPQLGAAE